MSPEKTLGTNSPTAGERLLGIIERIERLEEERKALASDIRDIKSEAKAAGFDIKVVNQMLRERRMSEDDRQEWVALCETYRAAIGMLDGTPLGDAARRRLTPHPGEPPRQNSADPATSAPAAAGGPTSEEIAAAFSKGAEESRNGKRITDNPFGASDPRRAAWDEGWCSAAGSDGMDIPAAWRRKPKKKGSEE